MDSSLQVLEPLTYLTSEVALRFSQELRREREDFPSVFEEQVAPSLRLCPCSCSCCSCTSAPAWADLCTISKLRGKKETEAFWKSSVLMEVRASPFDCVVQSIIDEHPLLYDIFAEGPIIVLSETCNVEGPCWSSKKYFWQC